MTWRSHSLRHAVLGNYKKKKLQLKETCVENTKEDLQKEIKKHVEIAENEVHKALNKLYQATGLVPENIEFKYLKTGNLHDGTIQYISTPVTIKLTL